MPGDILDQLWTEAINPDPEGKWVESLIEKHSGQSDPFRKAVQACGRMLKANVSPEDLGRHVRFHRYEACFSTLYALDDPGLESGKLKGASKLLKPNREIKKEEAFIEALWQAIGEEGDELVELENDEDSDEPFADAGPALVRLLAQGCTAPDLAAIVSLARFESCRLTLQALENSGMLEAEETFGLHESLLGADPSGKEGRPGSWPLNKRKPAASKSSKRANAAASDPTQPLFVANSLEAFCYSPDSRYLGVIKNGAPLQILDPQTGAEVKVFPQLKRFNCFAFSPDARKIVVADPKGISIHEIATGKILVKTPCAAVTLVDWDLTGRTHGIIAVGEVRRGKAGPGIFFVLLDSQDLTEKKKFEFSEIEGQITSVQASPDGSRLAIFDSPRQGGPSHMSLFTWPDGKSLGRWQPGIVMNWNWSSDSRHLGLGSLNSGVQVVDPVTGSVIWETGEDGHDHLAFSSDGKWLVTGQHTGGQMSIWDLKQRKRVRQFVLGTQWCFNLQLSPNDQVLGALSHRKSYFFRFQPLTE